MPSKRKILITGADGLLGRHAALALRDRYEIHAVVRAQPEDPVPGVRYHQIDLGGEWRDDLLPPGVDTIFHLAQSSRFRDFPEQAQDVFRVNVDSTARLLDYARRTGVRRFVFASSGGVYGAGAQAFHENSPIVPHGKLGFYLGSKLCSEILVENYAQVMTVVVLRLFFMYGAGQKRTMLIPRLIDSVRNGTPVTLQGPDGISINPVHVGDAVHALEKAASLNESCTLNIAGPEIISLRQIATLIGGLTGKTPIFDQVGGEAHNLIAGIEAMKQILGAPQVLLHDGLVELIKGEAAHDSI